MTALKLSPNASGAGSFTIAAPSTSSTLTLNLPSTLGTNNGSALVSTDASGNLGLGVTPSAWNSSRRALQIGQSTALYSFSTSQSILGTNVYMDSGGTDRYLNSAAATQYVQSGGVHSWNIAPSGTAGNAITFTQAMTLDASGNLVIGATSASAKLHVAASASDPILFANSAGGAYNSAIWQNNNGYKMAVGIGGGSVGGSLQDAAYVGSISNIPLLFQTNNTERARIDSSGNLLVGTTSTFASSKATIKGAGNTLTVWEQNGSSSAALICRVDITSGRLTTYNYNGSDVGTVTTNGTSTSYNTSSDYRLKENIQPMTGALAVVQQLKPVTYKWKVDGSDGQGFIAHELAEVVPQCVTGEKDAVDADGNPVYQGIDTSFLVATLTAALQELNAKVEAQAAEIAALKGAK